MVPEDEGGRLGAVQDGAGEGQTASCVDVDVRAAGDHCLGLWKGGRRRKGVIGSQ